MQLINKIYFTYLNEHRYSYCRVILPKRKGKGFLKSPCSFHASSSDPLYMIIENVFPDMWCSCGELYVLEIQFFRMTLVQENLRESLEKLALCFYSKNIEIEYLEISKFNVLQEQLIKE